MPPVFTKKNNKSTTKTKKKTKTKEPKIKKDNHDNTKKTYKMYHYNNGTKIILIPDERFKSMIITFTFKIGSKYEPVDLSGISHFLEHMLFKGTKKYSNHKIINTLLDSNGINFNAYTSKNVTGYYFKCLPYEDKLKLTLKIAYEMLFKSLIRQKDINQSERAIEYLNTKLQENSSEELKSLIYSLIEQQTKIIMLAYTNEYYALEIIDPPIVPDKKSSPFRIITMLIGALMGGIFSYIICIFFNLFKDKSLRISK